MTTRKRGGQNVADLIERAKQVEEDDRRSEEREEREQSEPVGSLGP